MKEWFLLTETRKFKKIKKFNNHFEKTVVTLKIDRPMLSDLSDDSVLNAIENSHHASVLLVAFPLNYLL